MKESLIYSEIPAAQGSAAKIKHDKRLVLCKKRKSYFLFLCSDNSGMNYSEPPEDVKITGQKKHATCNERLKLPLSGHSMHQGKM